MEFATPLIQATLLKRYKRFLADVRLASGDVVTATCPNTGTMLGLTDPGMTVYLSRNSSATRKYAHTWEMTERPGYGLIGINTARPNRLVEQAILAGLMPGLSDVANLRREVRYGANSRIDLLLEQQGEPSCYVEVKNVTLYRQPGLAEFPDCVTERGTKHLAELAAMVRQGHRAMMVYCIQGGGAQAFALTPDIDPKYVAAYDAARAIGVEAIAMTCHVGLERIAVTGTVPVIER
jgi:sugar fermentation stimulation protein A